MSSRYSFSASLLSNNIDVIFVDKSPNNYLESTINRLLCDTLIVNTHNTPQSSGHGKATFISNFDCLDLDSTATLISTYQPDIVVNYAIPFTWDAAMQFPNYSKISAAKFGALSLIQVLAPKIISKAIIKSKTSPIYIVGNLPDITIPIIYGCSTISPHYLPVCVAGNVGLIEFGIKRFLSTQYNYNIYDLKVYLCAHHIHWVAPREPSYPSNAPFHLKVLYKDQDITTQLGDTSRLLFDSITSSYEPGAEFSSSTGYLAARNVLAFLNSDSISLRVHVPSPNGLPGGYPALISNSSIELDIPDEWVLSTIVNSMTESQRLDGVDSIESDGSIHFDPNSVQILKDKLSLILPKSVNGDDIELAALDQLQQLNNILND